MLATIIVQSHQMSADKDKPYSPHSNAAGAPLPLVPRRMSSSQTRMRITPSPSAELLTKSPVIVTLEQPSPEHAGPMTSSANNAIDSDTSSSASESLAGTHKSIRARRIRRSRHAAVRSPDHLFVTPDASLREKSRNSFALAQSQVRASSSSPQIAAPGRSGSDQDTSNFLTPRPPLSRPMVYTPGALRLTTEALKASRRYSSGNHVYSKSESSTPSTTEPKGSSEWPRLVRKKSGQILKSSLKTSSSTLRSNLSSGSLAGSSKSEPTTPTHKAVHFDAHLEHVKLFLAEQKPLAVSRDGSPTDDTSGTDSDFPAFIYGTDDGDEYTRGKSVAMTVVNMPGVIDLTADVALEELKISQDDMSISGRICVRNIAYSKWVAVRFTFDHWQTTSEVTGRYLESINSKFDRFAFSIRLKDLVARIEEKILQLAVRYTVNGQEHWDNNNGHNYLAKFVKGRSRLSAGCPAPVVENADIAKLHTKLERVVQSKEVPTSEAAPILQPIPSVPVHDILPSQTSLTSRYSWGKGFKAPWAPTDISSPPRLFRHQSHPVIAKQSPVSNTTPLPASSASTSTSATPVPTTRARPFVVLATSQGSENGRPAPPEGGMLSPLQLTGLDSGRGHSRNHKRGYFDLDHPESSVSMGTPELRRTPPGTSGEGALHADDLRSLLIPRSLELMNPGTSTRHNYHHSHDLPSLGGALGYGRGLDSLSPGLLGYGGAPSPGLNSPDEVITDEMLTSLSSTSESSSYSSSSTQSEAEDSSRSNSPAFDPQILLLPSVESAESDGLATSTSSISCSSSATEMGHGGGELDYHHFIKQ